MTPTEITLALVALAATGGSAMAWRRSRRLQRRLAGAVAELEHLQTAFGRFAPIRVVDEIVAQGVSRSAERREVTVLFADLQDFTKMSEGLDPEALVNVLNGYFAEMSRAITRHNGHVSKFLGDGILALFGAVTLNPWQARDAVDAALAMRAALAEYNAQLAGAGRPTLRFGVGIHCGPVVAGVLGSHELLEYTVIGDTVNLAARVESLTRAHGVDILLTASVREALVDRYPFVALPPASVKGKSEPVPTWTIAAT